MSKSGDNASQVRNYMLIVAHRIPVMIIGIPSILAVLAMAQAPPPGIYDPHQDKAPAPAHEHDAEAARASLIGELIESGVPPKPVVQLHRMGDQAAQTIITVIGRRALNEREVLNILDILTAAFAYPRAIPRGPHRTPQAESVLLQTLANSAQDQTLKDRIASVRASVLAASNTVTNPANPVR